MCVKDKTVIKRMKREAVKTLISLSRLSPCLLDWRREKSSSVATAPEPQQRDTAMGAIFAFMFSFKNPEVTLTIAFDLSGGRWRQNQPLGGR